MSRERNGQRCNAAVDERKVLVIGSAVADVVIELDHLPGRSEDVHVRRQEMRLGGCAYNVCDMIRHFRLPFIPFMPVGTGVYGQFVRQEFEKRGIETPIPSPEEENGCCYCFVEADGERTFISYHGAEYRFRSVWFDMLKEERIGAVYICGLEIEEPRGHVIIEYLESLHRENAAIPIYFAPGPRLVKIDPVLMNRLFALNPVLHVNEQEACEAAEVLGGVKTADPAAAAKALHGRTGSTVIVTRGEKGSGFYDGRTFEHIPGVSIAEEDVTDTIGAGDSHIGAVIACRARGASWTQALMTANRISAAVVRTSGALLSDGMFGELHVL